jgi:hypothetical protein
MFNILKAESYNCTKHEPSQTEEHSPDTSCTWLHYQWIRVHLEQNNGHDQCRHKDTRRKWFVNADILFGSFQLPEYDNFREGQKDATRPKFNSKISAIGTTKVRNGFNTKSTRTKIGCCKQRVSFSTYCITKSLPSAIIRLNAIS